MKSITKKTSRFNSPEFRNQLFKAFNLLFIILIFATLFDIICTYIMIESPSQEGNDITRLLMQKYGIFNGLVIFDTIISFLRIMVLYLIAYLLRKKALIVTKILFFIFLLNIVGHIYAGLGWLLGF